MWSYLYVISDGTGKLLLYADNVAMAEFVKNMHSMGLEMSYIKSVNTGDPTKAVVNWGMRSRIKEPRKDGLLM